MSIRLSRNSARNVVTDYTNEIIRDIVRDIETHGSINIDDRSRLQCMAVICIRMNWDVLLRKIQRAQNEIMEVVK